MTAATAEGRPDAGRGRVRAFLRLVMIEHSVFALPFAYMASLTAMYLDGDGSGGAGGPGGSGGSGDGSVDWLTLLLVTVAMVGLRTFAMAANRIIDREIDARNPRTAHRELVTGVVSVRTAWVGAGVALAFFLGAAALLNPLCLALAPFAVVPMVVYPYGKRFTDFPHAILGLAQAMGPVGGWIAVTGSWSWDAVLLGAAVGLWIGGFDLIYACQDVDSDRAGAVRSVPARFGVAGALLGARASHVLTLGFFVWYAVATDGGPLLWVGIAVVAGAFGYEHSLVRPDDLSRLNRAFFTVNGFVGIALFAFALADLVARGLGA